jgi:hypothetical protein
MTKPVQQPVQTDQQTPPLALMSNFISSPPFNIYGKGINHTPPEQIQTTCKDVLFQQQLPLSIIVNKPVQTDVIMKPMQSLKNK